MKVLVILLAARFVLGTDGDEPDYIYNTRVGRVKCSTEVIDDKPIRKCAHIKYGEIEERFGESKPVPAIKNSRLPINPDSSPICVQDPSTLLSDFRTRNISEDCLYLHVFVPLDTESTSPLPVMFYIHGGGGSFGNGPTDPSKLLKKDVIVVTINYRLDIFGFLSTGTCDCPGNAGLKDVLLALQWVNANIASFGGNPNNVVLFGLSSGASIASILPYIPSACGLFNGLILESGSFNTPLSFITPQNALERAKEVGLKAGCDVTDPKKLCSCLKSFSASDLMEATVRTIGTMDIVTLNILRWLPTAENPECSNTFLTESPQDLLTKCPACNVKLIIGVTQEESCVFKQGIVQYKQYLAPLTSFAYKLAPRCLSETNNALCMKYVTQEIAAHYAKNNSVLDENNIMPLMSIVQFILPIMIYAKLMTKCGFEAYIYEFGYVGPCGTSQLMDPEGGLTCQAEMYNYIFKSRQTEPCEGGSSDKKITNILTELYRSFAASGYPSLTGGPKWRAWSPEVQAYLKIGNQLEIGYGLRNDEISFWKNVQDKCFVDDSNVPTCCSTCPTDYTPCVL